MLIHVSYEGSNDDKDAIAVSKHNENNSYYYNIVSDFESGEEAKEKVFE